MFKSSIAKELKTVKTFSSLQLHKTSAIYGDLAEEYAYFLQRGRECISGAGKQALSKQKTGKRGRWLAIFTSADPAKRKHGRCAKRPLMKNETREGERKNVGRPI